MVEWIIRDLLWPIGEHALELSLVVLANILPFFLLSCDFQQLLDELGLANLELAYANLAANFQKFHDVGGIPLDCFYSHVVVHAFLHECGISERLAFFRH